MPLKSARSAGSAKRLTAAIPEASQNRAAHLASYQFKPGQSGNPGGRTVQLAECQAIAREASPRAMRRLIELVESKDERVALMAADKVLERAWGKPKEPEDQRSAVDKMTVEQRRARVLELLAFAATLKVPETISEEDN